MKTGKVDISIIIPTKNEEANIDRCLKAILDQDTIYKFEIIVIDSGSTDRTVEIVNQCPSVRLIKIEPGEFGHGRTRNLGARQSKGETIVFLNADAIPVDKNWLHPLIGNLADKKKKKVAGVYSRHIPEEDCYLYMVRDIRKSMPARGFVKSRLKNLEFMIFSTVSCAVRRDIWQEFPFADSIIIAEDQDWAKRILSNGFKIVYEPESKVYHSHNYKLNELFAVKKKVGRTEQKFKNKFWTVTLGFLFIIGGILSKISGDIFFILFRSKSIDSHNKTGRMTLFKKMNQIRVSISARIVGFIGRYIGWIGAKDE